MYTKPSITWRCRWVECDSDYQVCDFEAETERYLSVHMKSRHLNDWPYWCGSCDKAFNTHNDRDTHDHSVHQEKQLKCKLCPYKASNEYKIAKHTVMHSSWKFKCSCCDVQVNSQEALQEHTKRHLDDSLYQCPQCDKTFTSEVLRTQHICGKHGAGYRCHKCSERLESLQQWSHYEKQCQS